MDWSEVEAWLLTEARGGRGLAAETVRETLRTCRRMAREGMDWEAFSRGPEDARRQVRGLVSRMKLDGRDGHPVRQVLKACNRVASYLASLESVWGVVSWRLPPEPKAQPQTVAQEELQALHEYRYRDAFIEKRRRAILYLLEGSGIRRGEAARLRLKDLDVERARVWVQYPTKRGVRRWVWLPKAATAPNRPIPAYLRAREALGSAVRDVEALWVVKPNGCGWKGISVAGFSRELDQISVAVGFRVSATRYRRFDTDRMDRAGVSPRAIQRRRGHARLSSTERYMLAVTPTRELEEIGRVPGFKR